MPTTMHGELASAPSPAAGRAMSAAGKGFTADAGLFPGLVVGRFGRGESGVRAERALLAGRLLPVFFATLPLPFLAETNERHRLAR